jgi:hypothetical protein
MRIIIDSSISYLSEFVIYFISENVLFESCSWNLSIKVASDPWMS